MSLNEKFDIESEPIESTSTEIIEYVPVVSVDDDAEFARIKMRELINTTMNAAEGIIAVATETESARDYEVVGQLLKTASEMTSDLLKLQKIKKEIDTIGRNKISKQVNNVFTGSLKDLNKFLAENRKEIQKMTSENEVEVEGEIIPE